MQRILRAVALALLGGGWLNLRSARFIAVLLLAGIAQQAIAQAYPTRAVHVIVPFPPGGAPDLVARLVAQKLSEAWRQPVIVDNRPGAAGNIGTAAVAKSAPDGYTLLLGTIGPLAVAPAMVKALPYDPLKDFTPITNAVSVNNLLVVNASMPIKSVAELVAAAKASPGKLNYGSTGSGATDHLAGEVFKDVAGVDLMHVPFKGGPPAIAAILNGDIQLSFATVPTVLAHIRGGRLLPLGVTGAKRLSVLPDVPTIREAGIPGYDVTAWYGVLVPAGASKEIVAKLNAEIVRALNSTDVSEKLSAQGLEPWPTTPEEFGARIREDHERWGSVVRKLGLTTE